MISPELRGIAPEMTMVLHPAVVRFRGFPAKHVRASRISYCRWTGEPNVSKRYACARMSLERRALASPALKTVLRRRAGLADNDPPVLEFGFLFHGAQADHCNLAERGI